MTGRFTDLLTSKPNFDWVCYDNNNKKKKNKKKTLPTNQHAHTYTQTNEAKNQTKTKQKTTTTKQQPPKKNQKKHKPKNTQKNNNPTSCNNSFQTVLHDWCNKGRGMRYPVCGMMHIKEPLLLIGKSISCGSSGFPLSLSEWSCTICLTPYNRK